MWVASRVSTALSEVPSSARRSESGSRAPAAPRVVRGGQEGGRADLAFGLVEPAQRQGGREAHQRIRGCGHDVGPDAARRLEEGLTRIGRVNAAGPDASSPGFGQSCSKIGRERPGRVSSAPQPARASAAEATSTRATDFLISLWTR